MNEYNTFGCCEGDNTPSLFLCAICVCAIVLFLGVVVYNYGYDRGAIAVHNGTTTVEKTTTENWKVRTREKE